jgi:hypothetical protein
MSIQCTYAVDCGYPAKLYFDAPSIEEELRAVAGTAGSSGMGFGVRDAQFDFDTRREAEAAADGIKDIFVRHGLTVGTDETYVNVSHQHWDEEWGTDLPDDEMARLMYPDEDCPEPVRVRVDM